jgi:hypothetical protein
MFALLGGVLGLFTSGLPSLFKLLQSKQDNAQELEVMKLQMEAAKQTSQDHLEEIRVDAEGKLDVAETQGLYDSLKVVPSGVKWIDAVISLWTSSVRPAITYAFMGLYCCVKYEMWEKAGNIMSVWTDTDMTVFTTIICFWFGHRAFERARKAQ